MPPAGLVNVALQTPQAIDVVAREKMMDSLPQSRQLTRRKWLVMGFTSAVDKFEFLGTLARSVVCFAGLCAPAENVYALRGLLEKPTKRVDILYRCTENGKAHYAPSKRAKKFELINL